MSTQKKGKAATQGVGSNTDTTKDNLQLEDELVNELMEKPFREFMEDLGIDMERMESRIREVVKRKIAEKGGAS